MKRIFFFAILIASSLWLDPSANAQSTSDYPPQDVIRINTELVQADLIVLDRKGHFVADLQATDLELRVNGKLRPILFFHQITAGSADEESQLAAARGRLLGDGAKGNSALSFERGRTILFYLDDYHLSATSINRLREMLTKFVDQDMGSNDEVAIVTATGQLGFLEQLTTERVVLHRAIDNFSHRNFESVDAERPPMSESEAVAIMSEDRRVLDYFVEQLLREFNQPRPRQPSVPTRSRSQFETIVKERARAIVDQTAALTSGSLNAFERFVRSSSQLPWHKLVFFISDGFLLVDGVNSNVQLNRITDAAAKSSTSVYSVDARGLTSGAPEAARKSAFDYSGRLASLGTRPVTAAQEPLRTIALEAGGEPILDTNDPLSELKQAIKQTSQYYQVAWRPDEDELTPGKFQTVDASIRSRPDAIIRMRRGFFLDQPGTAESQGRKAPSKRAKKEQPLQQNALSAALRSAFPRRSLPVNVSAGFIDAGEPTALVTFSLEIARDALDLKTDGDTLQFDLLGVVIDHTGKPVADFSQNLTVKPSEILSSAARRIVYNQQARLPAGLYQVRVAVAEKNSDRIGTAAEWIEVPKQQAGVFSLSSLFLGEVDANAEESGKLTINGNHRFTSASRLGFMIYVCNAASNSKAPDLSLQIQVLREGLPVITKPSIKIDTAGQPDLTRIAYGEELSLSDLPRGRYLLQISVIDRIAKTSAQQQARFIVY